MDNSALKQNTAMLALQNAYTAASKGQCTCGLPATVYTDCGILLCDSPDCRKPGYGRVEGTAYGAQTVRKLMRIYKENVQL